MRIVQRGDTLNILDLTELSARNSNAFRVELEPYMSVSPRIQVDLSATEFVDCCGVGALLSLHKLACTANAGARMTVLNPNRCIRRILDLTGASRVVPVDRTTLQSRDGLPPEVVAVPAAAQAALSGKLPAEDYRRLDGPPVPAALPTAPTGTSFPAGCTPGGPAL